MKINNGMKAIFESVNVLTQAHNTDLAKNIGTDLKDSKFKNAYKEAFLSGLGSLEKILENDTYGVLGEDYMKLSQLMDNVNAMTIKESIGTLTPAVALSHPLQYVNWIKSTIKNTIKVVVPDSTEIIKQFKRKYIVDKDGNRYEAPFAFKDKAKVSAMMNSVHIPLTAEQPASCQNKDILVEAGGLRGKDTVAIEFYVKSVKYTDATDGDVIISTPKRITRSMNGLAQIPVNYKGQLVATLMVGVDFKNGTLTCINTAPDKVKNVYIDGTISSESNLHTLGVEWDTEDWRASIPAGLHLNTNVSHEAIQDIELFYNVDQTKEVTDQMADVIDALKDIQLLGKLDSYYDEIEDLTEEGPYVEFDLTPAGNYALDPVSWRSVQLKDTISRIAVEMKKPLQSSGIFSIVGNDTIINLMKDLNWVWNEGSDRGGVIVNDAFGIFDHNGTTFKVTKSTRVPDDKLRVYFLPTEDTKETYVHFQHSTYVTNRYNNPSGNIALPNVMVTDRYLTTKIYNIQGVLEVTGAKSIFKKSK